MTPKEILAHQKEFFYSGKSRDLSFIISKLQALKEAIIRHEDLIYEALHKDFKKSKFETYFSEIGIVISEIEMTIKNLKQWSKPKKVQSAALTKMSGEVSELKNIAHKMGAEIPIANRQDILNKLPEGSAERQNAEILFKQADELTKTPANSRPANHTQSCR